MAPKKIAKVEELAPKKIAAKEEKRASNAGAKSKILIEEVETEAKVAAAPVVADEPKPEIKKQVKPKADPVKLAEKVEEIAKVENVVQKSEEVKPAPVVEGIFRSDDFHFLSLHKSVHLDTLVSVLRSYRMIILSLFSLRLFNFL